MHRLNHCKTINEYVVCQSQNLKVSKSKTIVISYSFCHEERQRYGVRRKCVTEKRFSRKPLWENFFLDLLQSSLFCKNVISSVQQFSGFHSFSYGLQHNISFLNQGCPACVPDSGVIQSRLYIFQQYTSRNNFLKNFN